MVSDAQILNRIERRLREGKASKKEIQILMEGYRAFSVQVPKDIQKRIKKISS
jgi:hypothetical protein